jgi:hypothetical protein
MDGVDRGFPPGDLRASDADRDRAVSELGEAFRIGRITADEFDQRSGQALRARTGKELTALLADLPLGDPPATRAIVLKPANHTVAVRSIMGRIRPRYHAPLGQGGTGRPKPRRSARRHNRTSSICRTVRRADHLPAQDPRRPHLAAYLLTRN